MTINEIEQHVASALTTHVERARSNWAEYAADGDSADIAQVLLSRLARSSTTSENRPLSHPSHRYVYPPSRHRHVYQVADPRGRPGMVGLTPACDFAQYKVEFVDIARADPLESNARYRKWAEAKSQRPPGTSWYATRQGDAGTPPPPGVQGHPRLGAHLDNVWAVAEDELEMMDPVASLASPLSQALLAQHSQFRGRIGVPDLTHQSGPRPPIQQHDGLSHDRGPLALGSRAMWVSLDSGSFPDRCGESLG